MNNRKMIEFISAVWHIRVYQHSGMPYHNENTSISRRGVFFCHDITIISKNTIEFSTFDYKFHNKIYSLPGIAGLY